MHIRFVRTLLFVLAVLCMSAASFAQVSVFVNFAPPPLPVYEQPLCPGEGYIWTPGYWAYGDDFDDYYWVPGTWVVAPEVGFLWTPAWWGWEGGRYFFHEGYWGPHVGFYGGVNYGFGYFGEGFEGGRWDHDRFFYNRSVTNINITNIHNVYNTTVIVHNENRVSFNGGNGGIDRRPTREEEAAGRDRHITPVADQTRHLQEARSNPQQRASENRGRPGVAATPRPGNFRENGVVPAREAGGTYTPPNRGGNEGRAVNNVPRPPSAAVHPRDLPPASRPSAPNTGNPKLDQKYQQQQEKQFAKQDQERQKLQQKQEQDHQRLAQQNANQARQQQVEQRHQQQTQQLQQRHEQQQQQMQQRQQPRNGSKPPKHG